MQAQVKTFFDGHLDGVSYVVFDAPGAIALVDSVLDYDPKSSPHPHGFSRSADRFRARAEPDGGLDSEQSPCHADHLGAVPAKAPGQQDCHRRQESPNCRTCSRASSIWSLFATNGSQFDHLFEDGDTFAVVPCSLGTIGASHTPPAWPTRWVMRCSWRYALARCGALRAATSPAATPMRCTSPVPALLTCHPRPVCSCATTTRPKGQKAIECTVATSAAQHPCTMA